jgi:hypothetical protein
METKEKCNVRCEFFLMISLFSEVLIK